jgi:hypothetical protein
MADAQSQSPDPDARQARQFWGELFEPDKSCTELLDRLLTAIASYIVRWSLMTCRPHMLTGVPVQQLPPVRPLGPEPRPAGRLLPRRRRQLRRPIPRDRAAGARLCIREARMSTLATAGAVERRVRAAAHSGTEAARVYEVAVDPAAANARRARAVRAERAAEVRHCGPAYRGHLPQGAAQGGVPQRAGRGPRAMVRGRVEQAPRGGQHQRQRAWRAI